MYNSLETAVLHIPTYLPSTHTYRKLIHTYTVHTIQSSHTTIYTHIPTQYTHTIIYFILAIVYIFYNYYTVHTIHMLKLVAQRLKSDDKYVPDTFLRFSTLIFGYVLDQYGQQSTCSQWEGSMNSRLFNIQFYALSKTDLDTKLPRWAQFGFKIVHRAGR